MPVVLAIALLAVGLAAGWLAARWSAGRSAPPAPFDDAPAHVADAARLGERIADALPLPALVVDGAQRIVLVNASASADLAALAVGGDVGAVSASLAGILERARDEGGAGARESVILGDPPRSYRVGAVALDDRVLAVLADRTEEVDFEEARRTFSAAVSHELRTPLARILGLAESLALPDLGDERMELVAQIEHEVDGIRRLIDEMLLLAALDRGRLAVADGLVDAAEATQRVVEDARQRRIGRGREIAVDVEPDLDVPVAARLYEVVVQNLVDNALIHGGAEAAVRVSLRAEGASVVLEVADTGPGIPAQHLPFIFQRFYRGDASRTGSGTGLGLALVKHIVEAHGGGVVAESDGERGALLRVTLPRA